MNKKLYKTSILFPLFLAGCMVGPDYERPKAEFAEAWNWEEAGKNATEGQNTREVFEEELVQWWRTFGDETLTSLIERAFESNLDIAAARARIMQSRATLGVTQSGFFPALNSNAGMSEGGRIDSSHASYSLGAGASWEVDVFGGTRRSIESSVADYRASLADKCAARVAVAAEVAKNYFEYRTLQQEIIITQSNLDTQKNTYNITLMKKEAGSVALLDVVRAAAQVQTTSAQLPKLESEMDVARHALELLLGLPSGALKEELKQAKDLPQLENFIPIGVPAQLVQRRPDIMVAEYRLHSAVAKIGQAVADYYPKLSVTGNISYEAPSVGSLVQNQYGTWSVGPSVTWNIFQAGKTYFNVELQEASAEEAGIAWKLAVLTAIKEVEDSLVQAAKERERFVFVKESAINQKKAYELSLELYEGGEIEFMDLLETQRTMLASEQAEILSRQLFINHIVSLYKSLGGGWNIDDMREPEKETRWLFFLNSEKNAEAADPLTLKSESADALN